MNNPSIYFKITQLPLRGGGWSWGARCRPTAMPSGLRPSAATAPPAPQSCVRLKPAFLFGSAWCYALGCDYGEHLVTGICDYYLCEVTICDCDLSHRYTAVTQSEKAVSC